MQIISALTKILKKVNLPVHSEGRSVSTQNVFVELPGMDHEPVTFDLITTARRKDGQWIIFPQNPSPPSTCSDTQEQHHGPIDALFSSRGGHISAWRPIFVLLLLWVFRSDLGTALLSLLHLVIPWIEGIKKVLACVWCFSSPISDRIQSVKFFVMFCSFSKEENSLV